MAPPTPPTSNLGLFAFVSSFDLIAIVLFILYSVRRFELQRRSAAEYPHAPAFDGWKRTRMRIYLVGVVASFLKPVLGALVPFIEYRLGAPVRVVWLTGGIVDPAYIVVMLVVVYKGYQSTKDGLRRGIDPSLPPPERSSDDSKD